MSAREVLEVDVLIVGAGPGGLAAAIRLGQLGKTSVAVIEKAKEVGAHAFSGAVMDPRGLAALLPDFRERGCPVEGPVGEDEVWILTRQDAIALPFLPPMLRNDGYFIVSLSKLVRWMAKVAEEGGAQIFAGFPGEEPIIEGGRVVGVRTLDKGRDKRGNPKSNFEPGVDIRAKATILAEGPLGTVTRALVEKFRLQDGRNPQTYATGVKEIWELAEGHVEAGRVIHTMGWPLGNDSFGGGFIYGMSPSKLAIGFVVGLDYHDPYLEPHHEFQRFKTHPRVKPLLAGGQMIEYGAKTIPEGGYFAIPKLFVPGAMIVGDSASLCDAMRLKGIHTAIQSGIFAAETAAEAVAAGDASEERMAAYDRRVRGSWIEKELWRSRFFKHAFRFGAVAGTLHAGMLPLTNGWSPLPKKARPGHLSMRPIARYHGDGAAAPPRIAFDEKLTFRKLTDVYYAGSIHDEDSPCHLLVPDPDICVTKCTAEFGNPCERFCPANVYEWVRDEKGPGRLQIGFSNCVHCKTCEIMDPYGNIRWVVPEGGGGPAWKNT